MPLLSPELCLAAFKTALSAAPNVGRVYDHRVPVKDQKTAKARFFDQASGLIRGWQIAPVQNNPAITLREEHGFHGDVQAGGGALTTFAFQAEGYFSQLEKDETEREVYIGVVWPAVLHLDRKSHV